VAELIPSSKSIAPYLVHNGGPGRWGDPRYADEAQVYLVAGRPWSLPPWITGRLPADHTAAETLWIPAFLRAGQIGFSWSLCGAVFNTSKSGGVLTYGPRLELQAFDPDLSTERTLYTSAMDPEAVPELVVQAVSSATWGETLAGATWLHCGDQQYSAAPVLPAPGILEVAPSRSCRAIALKLTLQNVGIVALVGRPVFAHTDPMSW